MNGRSIATIITSRDNSAAHPRTTSCALQILTTTLVLMDQAGVGVQYLVILPQVEIVSLLSATAPYSFP
jgi:hypothetical protein